MTNLNETEKQELANSKELTAFYRALASVQSSAVNYVRQGADVGEMKKRALEITETLRPTVAMMIASGDGDCSEGTTWDEVLQKCVFRNRLFNIFSS